HCIAGNPVKEVLLKLNLPGHSKRLESSTNRVNVVSENISNELPFDPNMPALEDISTFNLSSDHEDADEEADINNMDTTIQVSLVPTTRIFKNHPLDQVIGYLHSTTQTRNMGLLALFIKEQTIKTFKTVCLLASYHKKYLKRIGFKMLDGHVDNESQKGVQSSKNLRYQAQGSTRRIVPMETPASTALVSCDGLSSND
nr:hypothetical protein [Tanacetum cinerariifolium]